MNSWTQDDLYPCRHLTCSKGAQCIQTRRGQSVCAAYETVFTSEEGIVPLENERNILGFAASPVNRDITYYLLKSASGRTFIAETNYKTTLWRSLRILGMPRANVSHAHFGHCQQSGEFCLYMGVSYSLRRPASRMYYVRYKDHSGSTSAFAGHYVIENIAGRCGMFFLIPRGKIYTVESAGGEGGGGTLHLLHLRNKTLKSVDRKQLVNVRHVTMISLTLDGLEMLVMMKNRSCYNVGPGVVGKLDTMCDKGLQLKKDAIYVVWSLDGLNLLSLEHGEKGYQLRSYVRTKKKHA
ncbi:uncharacterized protein [Haliotis asinina]|uniref:uncharacterized protein n=1 Tax=Haliotis asinina TaxID=109174 RepID=UPI0035327E06